MNRYTEEDRVAREAAIQAGQFEPAGPNSRKIRCTVCTEQSSSASGYAGGSWMDKHLRGHVTCECGRVVPVAGLRHHQSRNHPERALPSGPALQVDPRRPAKSDGNARWSKADDQTLDVMSDEVAAALKLQRDARIRSKAQGQARTELSRRHPKEYRVLYDAARAQLEDDVS